MFNRYKFKEYQSYFEQATNNASATDHRLKQKIQDETEAMMSEDDYEDEQMSGKLIIKIDPYADKVMKIIDEVSREGKMIIQQPDHMGLMD